MKYKLGDKRIIKATLIVIADHEYHCADVECEAKKLAASALHAASYRARVKEEK